MKGTPVIEGYTVIEYSLSEHELTPKEALRVYHNRLAIITAAQRSALIIDKSGMSREDRQLIDEINAVLEGFKSREAQNYTDRLDFYANAGK